MNVIEALFVTLGLDIKEFEKGRKDVAAGMKDLRQQSAKTAKEMEEQGKHAAAAFSSVKVELLGLLATIGAIGTAAGLKNFIVSSTTGQADLGRLSSNLGMHAQRLEGWNVAAREVGETAENVKSAFEAVASGMAQAAIGPSAFTQWAAANQINLQGAKSYEEILLRISARMHQLADGHGAAGRQQALLMAKQGGVGDISQLLLQGRPEIEKTVGYWAKQSKETDKSTAAARRFQKALVDLDERFKNIQNDVYAKFEPTLLRMGNEFANWLDSVDWDKVITNVQRFLTYAEKLFEKLGGVKGLLIDIAAFKALTLFVNVSMSLMRIATLIKALRALRLAAEAASAAELAATAAGGGGAAGTVAKGVVARGAMLLGAGASATVAGVGALVYSKGLGGHRRADGTYEDEFDWNSAAGQAAIAKQKAAKKQAALKTLDSEREAAQFFMKHGWSKAQTAGILANLMRESELNPNAVGDHGQAYGIAQWHKDRQAAFEKWSGHSIKHSTLAEQLKFFNYELSHAEKRAGDMLKQAQNAWAAGAVVSRLDERPADVQGEIAIRGALAQQIASAAMMLAVTKALTYGKATPSTTAAASNTTIETHVEQVVVHTKATDANGIVRDMKSALNKNQLIAQTNSGLR